VAALAEVAGTPLGIPTLVACMEEEVEVGVMVEQTTLEHLALTESS
jgi:hypothetical protein